MHTHTKRARLLPAICLVMAGVMGGSLFVRSRVAHAQNYGFSLCTAGGQISIAGATPAVLISATSTTSKITIVGMKLATVTTGGIVTFYNGANASNTAFANGNGFAAYVPVSTSVNNNVDVGANVLPAQGAGSLTTSAGSAFCAQLNGSTLVYEIQYTFTP